MLKELQDKVRRNIRLVLKENVDGISCIDILQVLTELDSILAKGITVSELKGGATTQATNILTSTVASESYILISSIQKLNFLQKCAGIPVNF